MTLFEVSRRPQIYPCNQVNLPILIKGENEKRVGDGLGPVYV